MYRTKGQVDQAILTCIQDLEAIAMQDNVVTDDEKVLLEGIKHEFSNMQQQLVQVLESNLDEEEFNDLMYDMLGDIVTEAEKVANADHKISEDEKALLDRLSKLVHQGVGK